MSISNILIYRDTMPVNHPDAHYRPLQHDETVLKAGYQFLKGALPLPCDIQRERDFPLVMRDGVTLYANVFRPVTDAPVPTIVNWAPYGKGDTGFQSLDNAEMFPNRFGIKRARLSGMQSWEACDPAFWCAQGYAIVQVDARGAFNSEGDIWFLNRGEGQDVHDAIEELAKLSWCSGKIGMAGNSWLAMQQWRGASERPAHLSAIAPWEGMTDPYRDSTAPGGIPDLPFAAFIRDKLFGRTQIVDIEAMIREHPLSDAYWHDCCPEIDQIEVPAYIVASFTNPIHTVGTIRAWYELTAPKWLRIHNTQEWPDFYDPANEADLLKFFDYYLKGLDNGWEHTPSIRLAILDPGHKEETNRVEDHFPPRNCTARDLWLDCKSGTLTDTAPTQFATTAYCPQKKKPFVHFDYIFNEDTEIFGTPLLTVFAEVEGASDMDIHIFIEKLGRFGSRVFHQVTDLGFPGGRWFMPKAFKLGAKPVAAAFFRGSNGRLRATRRGLDPKSRLEMPGLALDRETPLPTDAPVKLEIPLSPIAMKWHKGERLRLTVSGVSLLPVLLPGLPDPVPSIGDIHTIHSGPNTQSKLTFSWRPSA